MSNIVSGFTIENHFAGRTATVRAIYDKLLHNITPIGPVVESPKKTSIHLNAKTAFAGVATRKEYLILTIKSDRALKSPRIHKSEQTSAKRFHHEIKLTSTVDVDAELIGWLRDAYALSL